MKISIVTGPWLPVPAVQGGAIPRLWQGLAEQFAHQGHHVSIICRNYPNQPKKETIKGVHYIRHSGFPQSRSIAWDLAKDCVYAVMILSVLPHADILVINDFWLPVFVKKLSSDAGKVVINVARFPKGQLWLYADVDQFIATSQAVRQAMIEQYPRSMSRIEVIPNPIDTSAFFSPPKFEIEKSAKTILYVGRIHPEKGIHLLLDAFSIVFQNFREVKLRILGPVKEHQGGGGDSYLRILKEKSKDLPVEFLAPVFNVEKLANVYFNADLFCYPSLAEKGESFGVAPLEAMAVGLVPVVSNLNCFRDFIEQDKTGYFFEHRCQNPHETLAVTLHSALANWKKTSQMGKLAALAATEFSYQRIAALYLKSFQKLI